MRYDDALRRCHRHQILPNKVIGVSLGVGDFSNLFDPEMSEALPVQNKRVRGTLDVGPTNWRSPP